MPESHLIMTKFTVPFLRTQLLARTHLIEQLNQSCGLPLVLLSATAGFGKTTLLSSWASQSTRPICWLSLDELDNDPERFWASVVTALQAGSLVTAGDMIRASHQSQPPFLSVLTSLINDLAASPLETIFILDDYHVIQEPAIHSSFAFLLDHAPASLHVVLSSRVDPPLPLSRWRVRGRIAEIRDTDLRLSEVETASFLSQVMGLSLWEKEVQQLFERTEGWIAGVQLAGLALQRTADQAIWVRSFRGSHRFILDYVQEEILARQPPGIQQFLLHTAILSELNAALCQALTGEAGGEQASQGVLEALERANLFIVPLDEERRWYRYHALFREALLTHLRTTTPEMLPPLHRRAATWYAAKARWALAIPHALSAGDEGYAADLIERFVDPDSFRNEYHMLRRWLAALSSETLRSRPYLSSIYVNSLVFTSVLSSQILELVEEPLRWAEQGFREAADEAGLGAVLTMRATLLTFQGAFAEACALAHKALPLLSEQEQRWRGHCLCLLALEMIISGQPDHAHPLLLQCRTLLVKTGSLPASILALIILGEVSLSRGDLRQAESFFRQALAHSHEHEDPVRWGNRGSYYERLAYYELTQLFYEWNDLEKAQQYLQEALTGAAHPWIHILTPGILLQIRLLWARGEVEQAHSLMHMEASRQSRPEILQEIRMAQAWLALKMGERAIVEQWSSSISQTAEHPFAHVRREEESLLLARLRIAEGQPQAALDLLSQWKQQARVAHRGYSELQILLLEALAHEQAGVAESARAALLEALTQARPEGYQRLFLDEGIRMEALLKSLLPDLRDKALASYVRVLLRAFVTAEALADAPPVDAACGLVDPLTAQEQRVLQQLAQGASNQEIADALVIQLSTARKHISSILSKLSAANRTQAIARAREYGLL
ncbi:LuxR family transcriptional regulator [Reticulibacter mediterranei]|uniref:LuxR family transcriptional regulator n=1 Tax=Reticulibacter mediterranei TaxID=2778369 RepID=A0A8J3ISH8_9CHLR|nr:LuxR C-terminal-related transcriptional regulator [Reticulibacter mediterranei]GHO97409.1 LuxR family transcriptional regulator [Reticulibacter mediterranei]GHP01235.1 LuxR family transcriptional regulator [Reticulibacter mediterranei]